MKAYSKPESSIKHGLNTVLAFNSPILVNKLVSKFCNAKYVCKSPGGVERHDRTGVICPRPRDLSYGRKLLPNKSPVSESLVYSAEMINDRRLKLLHDSAPFNNSPHK